MASYLRVTSDLAAEAPVLYSKFGIVGDGTTFDHRGVASLIAALEDSGIVHLAGTPTMLLGETVTFPERRGQTLTTDRRPFPDGINVPKFIWDGPRGGSMLVLDRCWETVLDGFAIETDDRNGARQPAGVGIELSGGQDESGSGLGTSCTLSRLKHITNIPELDCLFIAIARATHWNQEYHEIIDCAGNGNGKGSFLYIGPDENAKQIYVAGCKNINGYDKAIWMRNGSLHLDRNKMNWNVWNLYLQGATERCSERATSTEASQHHAYYNVPIKVELSRFDPSHTPPDEDYIVFAQGTKRTKFAENGFDVLPTAKGARIYGFTNDASHRSIKLEGNDYPWPATLKLLGLDLATLRGRGRDGVTRAEKQAGQVVLEGENGITDLPSGNMRFNAPRLSAYARGFTERDRSDSAD